MAKQNSTKNYIRGSAKSHSFNDGGTVINLDLNLADLNALPVNERGYIKVIVAERSSADQYGNTHYVYENAYVPKSKEAAKESSKGGDFSKPAGKPSFGSRKPSNDVPF